MLYLGTSANCLAIGTEVGCHPYAIVANLIQLHSLGQTDLKQFTLLPSLPVNICISVNLIIQWHCNCKFIHQYINVTLGTNIACRLLGAVYNGCLNFKATIYSVFNWKTIIQYKEVEWIWQSVPDDLKKMLLILKLLTSMIFCLYL